MNYQEALDTLYNSLPVFHREGPGAYKPGLETSLRLNRLWGDPISRLRTIHIAGTNGKGSTAHTLAAILQAAGYRTGLYTSPHIFDFGERIRVDGAKIPPSEVVAFVEKWEKLSAVRPDLKPSFFELTSTMAFDWFSRCNVDYAVIETGLGGRLDSTNIITPLLSIITNISLDHTEFLGNTLKAISGEKAGIIKEGVPVVIGERNEETLEVFESVASDRHAPLTVASPVEMTERDDRNFYPHTPFGPLQGQLKGGYQRLNTATVLAAVSVLRSIGIPVTDEAVREGIAHVVDLTGLKGRWTLVATRPDTVIDTGHNAGGWEQIAAELRVEPHRPVTLVCGFVADKDLSHIFSSISSLSNIQNIIWSQPSSPRGLPAEELSRKAAVAGLEGRVVADVNDAVSLARKLSTPEGLVLVAGSNYLIADLRPLSEADQ